MSRTNFVRDTLAGWLLLTVVQPVFAGDWPQFMGNAAHTGDSRETLRLPLDLATCVGLDDAVNTSPAVVDGRVYVVDQMGTAYCINPKANRIVWKTAPDGNRACGANTSSVCVAKGRAYFGTTAGSFHVLGVAEGKVQKSLDLGWPITGSPTWANDSVYVQTLGGVVHCLKPDGTERWRWDHYKEYRDPKPHKRATGFPGSFQDPHYGGGEVAVSGKRVVVNLGWDLFCLEDQGDSAKLAWCNRAVLGKDGGIPMGPAIAGEWVYCGYPSTDQMGGLLRVKLADGSFDEKKDFRSTSYPGFNWAVLATPAVRDSTAFIPTHYMGTHAFDFGTGRSLWKAWTDNTLDQRRFTSTLGSPILADEHCVFGTTTGDLYVVAINARGSWPEFKPASFKFSTPFGKAIASPVVAGGAVYFGCDDGYFYGLAPAGRLAPPKEGPKLWAVRSKVNPATGKRYGAPVASMDQGNSNCVEDARLKPPLRLRWACRPFDLRVQISADEDSIYWIAEAGTLAAQEQATGRIRWRRRLNGPVDGWKQLLLDGDRLFITRNSTHVKAKPGEGGSEILAIDARTGETLWQAPWGSIQGTCRTSLVVVGKVVAGFTAEGTPPKPVARAFDAATGKPLWRHELPADLPKGVAGGACVLDGIVYFSCGATWGKGTGSTVAIEPGSGKVLWTSTDYHVHGYGRPAAKNGCLYLGGQSGAPMYCLSGKDGTLKWKVDNVSYSHNPALGDRYFVVRGYGGDGILRDMLTGKPVLRDRKEVPGGCPDHACSPVLLSSGGLSYAVSSSGLYVRDLDTGKVLWQSLGFAPRACTSPVAANGRLFFSPNANNTLYCFEPVSSAKQPPE